MTHMYCSGLFVINTTIFIFILQLYVLEDTDAPASPSKKTSRELAGTLRNLKKVEQALQLLEGACFEQEEDSYEDDADDEINK